jgi:hypothetical protein
MKIGARGVVPFALELKIEAIGRESGIRHQRCADLAIEVVTVTIAFFHPFDVNEVSVELIEDCVSEVEFASELGPSDSDWLA